MQNGSDMGNSSTQGAMIVPYPGNNNLYYFFNFEWDPIAWQTNFLYSVIDMTLDNGLGGVIPFSKSILLLENTTTHLSAVFHKYGENIWVLTHGSGDNLYYSYIVTPLGLSLIPVVSSAGTICDSEVGYLKISPNGKKIAVSQMFSSLGTFFDLVDFDNETGVISDANLVHSSPGPFGLEFSPDNSKLYGNGGGTTLCQYNLNAGTPQQILDSRYQLINFNVQDGALQLGPDGKIVCATDDHSVGIIHNPNELGSACNYEHQSIDLAPGTLCYENLPSFIQSYLNDPEFTTNQYCFGQPTQFNITSINGIDSVKWKFKDFGNMPNDTSSLFNPLYTFSAPGTYYPELTVWSGLLPPKTVKDTVVIYASASPNLGNDTTFCPNDPINLTLDAGPGEQYAWNNNLPTVDSTFIVTDTGTYWVRVNANGCFGRDTINISRYDAATADLTNLDITPSNCGSSDGAITGIQFSAPDPFTVTWLDIYGSQVGSGNDLLNVSAGSYFAEVTFGNNCIQTFGPYSIADNNAPVIASALPGDDDHCLQGMGSIIVTPESGNVTDYQYSFNETDFFPLTAEITELIGGTYDITLKDQFGCISLPVSVEVQNVEGPEIYCNHTNTTGGNANGTITVDSQVTNLTYQLNSGQVQTSNEFTGLAAGNYTITVTDEFGCETQCEVSIENNPGIPLSAMAGDDKKCLNELANSNIRVSGVSGVKEFTASLAFDGQKLQCIHFNDSLPGIISTVYPGTSRVVLEWYGTVPLTNNDTISLGELVFETLESGFADINWDSPPVTRFLDEYGNIIIPNLMPEKIIVHDLPVLELNEKNTYCQGESIHLTPVIAGGTEPMIGQWITPTGSHSLASIDIDSAGENHSGQYSYSIRDYFGCADTVIKAIQVVPLPAANFPATNPTHDTIFYEQTFLLEATPGYTSYEWNTGDTTYYITVTEEGAYSLLMETTEGCLKLENIMMIDTFLPVLVPNAFTPNNDGLNDTFRPVVDYERVRMFSMVIYNRWGQLIFETTNPAEGWNGKDAPAGVYSWVISYSDMVGKVAKMRGGVTLVK
ncbi:MAG: hypothetical protein FD170_1876 [Bacteroidetes bacterium]|nr:MAG: hypothetical protein FD170_1876 [Bacteroidota bacterium]